MTAAAAALLAQFELDAKTAQVAEAELRKSFAVQLAKLERQRAYAFRRTRLVRTLAQAVPEGTTVETAAEIWPGQSQAISDELGWSALSDSYRMILSQLAPVGHAIACRMVDPESDVDVLSALETFEAWFESTHAKPFYVLFDQYVPQVPVVDF